MNGNKVTSEIIRKGVSFPEGIPTKWHYCTRGDQPRTILCYEEQSVGRVILHDARCVYEGHFYSDVFTFNKMSEMKAGELTIETWDQFSLCIS